MAVETDAVAADATEEGGAVRRVPRRRVEVLGTLLPLRFSSALGGVASDTDAVVAAEIEDGSGVGGSAGTSTSNSSNEAYVIGTGASSTYNDGEGGGASENTDSP